MKITVSFILLFFISSCSNNKVVYWCGDHACINKKEREAHFKKTLTVEVKNINNDNLKNDSSIKKIQDQVFISDKKRKELDKQAKIDKKKEIQIQKELDKQAKIDQKKEIQKQKELDKQSKLEQKKEIQKQKELDKQSKLEQTKEIPKEKNISRDLKQDELVNKNTDKFSQILERITGKNFTKPFPNINDIQN